MGAVDETERFGREVSDIDFMMEVDELDFDKALAVVYGQDKGLFQKIYGHLPPANWLEDSKLLKKFFDDVATNTKKGWKDVEIDTADDLINDRAKGLIFDDKMITDSGEKMFFFLNNKTLKTYDFGVEFTIKRASSGTFIDPPYLIIN